MSNKLNIWVTGSTGFIGSNFLEFLEKNHDPQLVLGEKIHDFKISEFSGDVRNFPEVKDMKNADIIFHFGSPSSVKKSFEKPREYFESIVGGTFNLLELARKNPIKRIVCISSVEVYGDIPYITDDNDIWEVDPKSPYAVSKVNADFLCKNFYDIYGIPVVVLRLSTQYGPRQSLDKIIPKFIRNVTHGKPMTVFGKGEATRRWSFIFDTLEGIFNAGTIPGIDGEIFNLCTGEEASIIDIAEMISKNMQEFNPKIEYIPDESGRAGVKNVSSERAKRKLKCGDSTPLEEGLKKTIEWYSENTS